MPAVSVIVPSYDQKTGRPKMSIMASDGTRFDLPYAPRVVDHSNLGEEVVEIERPGRITEIAVKNPKLAKMSFEFTIGSSIVDAIELDLWTLRRIADLGGWVQILYGQYETGLWKITNLSYQVIEREPLANYASRAKVSMDCTQVPDGRRVVAQYSDWFNFRNDQETYEVQMGLVNTTVEVYKARDKAWKDWNAKYGDGAGGFNHQPVITSPLKNPVDYIVQQGDTLMGIAKRFYGELAEQFWRIIGDVNGVLSQLNIGQILRIP